MRRLVPILVFLAIACGDSRRRTQPPARPPAVEPVRLMLRGYTFPLELGGARAPAGRRFLQVDLTLENTGSANGIPAGWSAFELTTLSGGEHVADRTESTNNPCTDTDLALRASRTCALAFELEADARPARISYDSGAREYEASFDGLTGPPMLCAEPAPEDGLAACSDACNNDGDPYLDCNDADCCSVRADCPAGTYCAGSIECDCNDPECCDRIACGPETYCGQQPDPFTGALVFDDAAIGSIDPASLRAGDAPCRAPALVGVDWVNDGDTMEVSGEITGLVRMIGVDTPEIGRNGEQSDCFAEEASAFTQALRGHLVWLTFDAECKDQYERNLAYVHIGSGSADLFQRHLLRRGFARTLTVHPNDSLAELFAQDQALADQANEGLWQACP